MSGLDAFETTKPKAAAFSNGWALLSVVVFCAVELFIGGYLGDLVAGRFVGIALNYKLQMMMMLASYFIGGFIIGVLSPGVRIFEPAVGAFASVAMTFAMRFFVPMWWFRHASLTDIAIGGAIAGFLAYYGAKYGEKLTGNVDEV